jgi:hypothetical protein
MNLEEINNRNKEYLEKLIKYYKIEFSYEQLINEFNSLYIHTDFELKRLRLLGVQNIYVEESGERIKLGNETKRTQIYVLKKKDFEKLELEDLNTEISKLEFFKNLWYQNLFIKNIENLENFIQFKNSFHYLDNI